MKTKPTQQSVGKLREIGIQPQVLICRTEKPMTEEMAKKISLFCNVRREAVIEERDVDFSIYQVPTDLVAAGLDRIVCTHLKLPAERETELADWRGMLERIRMIRRSCEVAVVGKYIELHDAYKSIYESLDHAGIANDVEVKVRKVKAEDVLDRGTGILLGVDGVLVPGGFGERGMEGKIEAVRWARDQGVPFFGICLGLQCAVVEYARNVAGLEGAHSIEHSPHTPHPVIHLMPSQERVHEKGGTMRLGAYACSVAPGTRWPRWPACSLAAATKPRKIGCGRSGLDLNSGWNWTPTKKGWSGSSMISTRPSSGLMPLVTRPPATRRSR